MEKNIKTKKELEIDLTYYKMQFESTSKHLTIFTNRIANAKKQLNLLSKQSEDYLEKKSLLEKEIKYIQQFLYSLNEAKTNLIKNIENLQKQIQRLPATDKKESVANKNADKELPEYSFEVGV